MPHPQKSLSEICTPKQWPTIPMKDLDEDGFPVYGANGIIGYYHEYNHENPTILITCRGATCGTVNVCAPKSYVTGNAMCLDNLKEEVIDLDYLRHFLKSRGLDDVITGSAQPQITRTNLSRIMVPLPSLTEQKRIAAILDKADEIKQSSDTTKGMRQQVIGAIFLEMFGDPANPDIQWTRKPFGGLMECKNSSRVPVKKSERETTEETYPYYGASGIVDYVDDYLFEGEHLLISEDGANLVARVSPIAFIATGQFWVNNHAHVFVENGNLDAVYCETLFSLLDLSNHITGSAQPKLNKGNLDKIVIPVPPLKIQTRFRQIIENISKIWGQIDERNSALRENSNSLIQELIE
jgi:type I restriction enzyme, S subunit